MNENGSNYLQDLKEVPYPPAPWRCSGQMWTGIFKSTTPRILPADFKHILDPHLFIVSLIRYLDGTLRYDEVLFSTPARIGPRFGAYITNIWVDDLASLWGGRRIWGLPKNMASFNWSDSAVEITDERGLIAKISVDLHPSHSPLVWSPIPGFGNLEGNWTHYIGSIWTHLGKSGMKINEWSDQRFGMLQSNSPSFSFRANPIVEIQVPNPKILKVK